MDEIVSINPATLETVGRVPITTSAKVHELMARARAAQRPWERLGAKARSRLLLKAAACTAENAERIARTITQDNGKPLAEAVSTEIYPVVRLLRHIAARAPAALSQSRLGLGFLGAGRRSSTLAHRALGCVGIISPWNYPFSIPMGQAAAALAAGNAVLLKPSSAAPMVGCIIEEIFGEAGLPEGIFTHVPGDAETGRSLISARPDKLAFTGSAATGRDVMRQAAAHLTPLLMELGGKDPMIVRSDADIERAASGAVWGAFTNAGQACASVERCYAHASIFDEFVEICVRKAMALKVGNGLDPDVEVGPMTTLAQLEHVEAQVIDAKARGANVICGGARDRERSGFFFPPTVLTGADHSFPIVRDESFGPVLPIIPFEEDMQAVRLANDSAYGLTASVWSGDIASAKKMAAELAAGTVMINDCVFTHALPAAPWGGVKQSGFGRSHGDAGILEFTSATHLHTNSSGRKDMWWFGYDLGYYEDFCCLTRSAAKGLAGALDSARSLLRRWKSPRA